MNQEKTDITIKEIIGGARRWWGYLLSKWLLIVCFGIIGGIIGMTYAIFRPVSYVASSTFVLEDSGKGGGGLGQYAGLASMVGVNLGDAGGGIFQGDNLFALYKSRNMLQRALLSTADFGGKKMQLIDRYIEFNHLRDKWKNDTKLSGIDFKKSDIKNDSRVKDSVISNIVADINRNYMSVIKPDKKLSIIKVEVKAPDELFAKAFNDQIVKTVNEFYTQTKTKKSLDNILVLERQTDSVRNVLSGAIFESATVSDATPNLNPTRLILRAPAQRSQYNAEANKAILSQLIQNLELSKLTLRNETPLIQMIDGPVFPLEKDKLGKLKALIIGGIAGGFLAIIIVLLRKSVKAILSSN